MTSTNELSETGSMTVDKLECPMDCKHLTDLTPSLSNRETLNVHRTESEWRSREGHHGPGEEEESRFISQLLSTNNSFLLEIF